MIDYITAMNLYTLHKIYIVFIILLTILVLINKNPKNEFQKQYKTFSDVFSQPPLAEIMGIIAMTLTILATYIGFRIPIDIETFHKSHTLELYIIPTETPESIIGRSSQVISAICFFLITSKLIRMLFEILIIIAIVIITIISIKYVISS